MLYIVHGNAPERVTAVKVVSSTGHAAALSSVSGRAATVRCAARGVTSQGCNKPGVRIPLGQLDILKRYAWPGNIRELENVIERQVIVSQDRRLVFDDLLSAESGRAAPASLPAATERGPLPEQELSRRQHDNAITALMQSAGKVSGAGGAAELLGIKPTTLFSRLRKWGIEPADYKVNDKAS